MNRFGMRSAARYRATFGVGALAAALALTGCGAGQVSQMATQQPAINGTGATVGDVDLRNVHLRAVQDSDYVRPGDDVELLFVAVNGSDSTGDRLLSVASDVGSVELTGDTALPPGGSLIVGTPDLQPSPLDETEGAGTAEAQVSLTKPISNGLNYAFTFTFEKAGEKKVEVPISAGEAPRRDGDVGSSEGGGHSGGGH